MAQGLVESGEMNLVEVHQLCEYRGFVVITLEPEAVGLETYLADAKAVLDLVSEQGETGMEVVGGTQEYAVNANWKLLQENSADGYHAATTHSTYLDYIASRDGMSENTKRMASPGTERALKALPAGDDNGHDNDFNRGRGLGNGHAVIASVGAAPWGRPYARWGPGGGGEAKAEITQIAP